jgi:hypothetical protein
MKFFKNKHIIASMIIAPILAVISWFAVDHFVKEVPHQLESGNHYKMLVKSNCRWGSGKCDLENNDIKITLTVANNLKNKTLNLNSSAELTTVQVGIAKNIEEHSIPQKMLKVDESNYIINFDTIDSNKILQLVASINGAIFYATIPTIFINKEELIYDQHK